MELEFLASRSVLILRIDLVTSTPCRHWRHGSMAQFHMTDKQSSLQKADEAKAIGHDDESIVAYILGGDQNNVSGLIFSVGQSHRK